MVAPEYWLYFLGALFIAVTLFLPDGIVGLDAQMAAAARKVEPALSEGRRETLAGCTEEGVEAGALTDGRGCEGPA